ncbi:LuxR C-terminal-related transcriptional regulator [Solirubrobacter phytolaccae]|uniref:LuxR C-terminal-related transcriptional regulator n=1 Tax=Solirubrobacter phytolaccae TaxID=1404360 RepID=A0A9X3S787_9ACTN|nr:LuxR family transcriptional regulator [Solirubrobacter phytolaccae]MDA0180769.1 LuxR C-terminal-related transcriptional regulator [Solirubrobacter phytolaccae]
MALLEREAELDVVRERFDQLGEHGETLVVRGEPGAGKSALVGWVKAEAAARGLLVLSTVGVQSEALMPFSGLQQLLRPAADRVSALPDAQRDALLSVFGAAAGAPDPYLVGLATLTLLGDLAAGTPMLLVADDAQWLDRATGEALAFVARRLDADPILLLASAREESVAWLEDARARELRLAALSEAGARRLIEARAPWLAPDVQERVLVEAAGNPLALIELPIAWRDRGGDVLADTLPLTARLERAFASRVTTLPAATATLLLVAALNDAESLAETLDAGARLLGARPQLADLAPAEAAGLIGLDAHGVRFRHPLVRSAIRQAAGTVECTRAHAALAEALAGEPDRSVWHRAAGTLEPDEDVASALEAAAGRAKRRGDLPLAVTALKRAAALTAAPAARALRLIAAAELEHQLGREDEALQLLRQVDESRLDDPQLGRLLWLREVMHQTAGPVPIGRLVALAGRMLGARETGLALDVALAAAYKAYWFDAPDAERRAIVNVARRLGADEREPRLLATLALADPVGHGALVIERLADSAAETFADPEEVRLLGIALIVIPEYELAGTFLALAVERLREQGRLAMLARALGSQAHAALFRGDFALAEQAAEEGLLLTRETRQPRWECSCLTFLAHLAGLRGDAERAEAQLVRAEQLLHPPRSTPALQHLQLARGAVSLAAGEPEAAFDQITRVFDPEDSTYNPLVGAPGLVDLADAAATVDRLDDARAIVERIEPLLLRTGSPTLHSQLRYARAVLAEPEAAEACFQDALGHDTADSTWERARLRLAHGVWLRRQRRAVEARVSLRIAREGFDALGAHPWSERARQELRATGERSRRQEPNARDALTPQELQIAQLAAEGLTNRDIGKRLFMSHRTVGSHLYKIFPKLGITSRAELARAVVTGADR